MSKRNELLSSVGVDYTPIYSLLASSQWQKADEETVAVMLKIARRVTAGWLREEDIESFPCQDLLSIDRLWMTCSQGRFGFTVQSQIWKSVGENYSQFSDAVGWRLHGSWLQYSNLIFTLNAPAGHLPAAPFFKSNALPIGWAASLKSKLADCCDEDF